jgi:hypothetical protein
MQDLAFHAVHSKMKPLPVWNRAALLQSPLFAPLHPILTKLDGSAFPVLQDCNALLAARQTPITVKGGLPLRFVEQEYGKLPFQAQYEPRCYLKGEVPTRAHNWHDLLNALVWLTFPGTKAIINAHHYHALTDAISDKGVTASAVADARSERGAVRDVNTLFDESGVIVLCADPELTALLRDFKWQELFWQRRGQVQARMGFYLFGHGLYEKALHPYIGMTGQGLVLAVEQEFFDWPLSRQLVHVDGLLANYLAAPQHCRSTRDLSPVPLLGVPGWAAENDCAEFYANTAYFRSGRRG